MKSTLKILLAISLVVVLAGCLNVASEPQTKQPTATTIEETPTSTDVSTSTYEGSCVSMVAFYGGPPLWKNDTIRIGYTVMTDSSGLIVLYLDGEMVGSTYVNNDFDKPTVADGDAIELNTSLSGNHTLRLVAYEDVNENQEYDPNTDEPCVDDGREVSSEGTYNFG